MRDITLVKTASTHITRPPKLLRRPWSKKSSEPTLFTEGEYEPLVNVPGLFVLRDPKS